MSQLRNAHAMHPHVLDSTVELAGSGDFMVNGGYSFELGGQEKRFQADCWSGARLRRRR